MKPTALIILDGWGVRAEPEGNAIIQAHPKNFLRLKADHPYGEISASGLDVGLPAGQMGNSEVGHLNIGAGRVVYQPLTQIHRDLEDGTLYRNPTFVQAFARAKASGQKFHFLGLLSDGGVHSHIDHLKGMLRYAKQVGLERVYVHAFLDGRDTLPTSGKGYLEELQTTMREYGLGKIATVSGRYYAMDRDRRWERVEKAYLALVEGEGETATDVSRAMDESYERGITDEFFLPTVIDRDGLIEDGDTVLFFNFRPDRAREMSTVLTDPTFEAFPVQRMSLDYYGLTQYDTEFQNVKVIYEPQSFVNTMGEYLSNLEFRQFRIAETEKYAHVTFFFNGGREEPFSGEERVLIPSPKVATYDLEPAMSAEGIKDRFIQAIQEKNHDFYLCNFANPDMVGHTGVMPAAIQAIQTVDGCLGEVVAALRQAGVQVLITADHGNSEEMIDPATDDVLTAHTTNPVPLIIIADDVETIEPGGRLADLSPTILDLMGLEQPKEMTGHSLIRRKQ
ncbi:MAG TPA: 2,3-bisphosphoglycerate-independent phosphoglycerate mutase [Tissierellia bacterium]|nr:2,3-bisphosphoglycerate-independent phosphoglycerate mutase [Tissierellia bacterium]